MVFPYHGRYQYELGRFAVRRSGLMRPGSVLRAAPHRDGALSSNTRASLRASFLPVYPEDKEGVYPCPYYDGVYERDYDYDYGYGLNMSGIPMTCHLSPPPPPPAPVPAGPGGRGYAEYESPGYDYDHGYACENSFCIFSGSPAPS